MRKRLERLRRSAQDHYPFQLPGRIGALPDLLLGQFYKGVALPQKQTAVLQALPKDALTVLVTQYESRFERLFYHTRYREMGHPPPTLAFDQAVWLWQPLTRLFRILVAYLDSLAARGRLPDPYASGFWRRALFAGEPVLLALAGSRGFERRFVRQKTDPVAFLVDLQRSTDRPIVLVPHVMVYTKRPDRSTPGLADFLLGPERNPGWLRRTVTLFKRPGKIFVEVADPLDLRAFLEEPDLADMDGGLRPAALRRRLLEAINRHRQAIVGPVLKTRIELKQNLLTAPRMAEVMEAVAASEGLPMWKVHQKADAYFEEIAANYNPLVIRLFDVALTWIVRTMFDGVILDQDGLDAVKRWAAKGPVILLPCHKSHIDYLMLSYVMHYNDMPCPHVVAGKNLSFWPMGYFFRNAGAFFMRRSFKGDILYAGVFSAYVAQLLKEGFNIEVFIEGGRSRTGKLLSPRTGFLSMLLDAVRHGACRDITLAPVFIGYDKVPEEKAYLHELEGGKKEPDTLTQVIRARQFLSKRFGKIYIQFAAPFRLGELVHAQGFSLETASKSERDVFCRHIGHRVLDAINRVTVITPHCVMASALLNCGKERFAFETVSEIADTYCRHLQFHGARLADTLTVEPAHSLSQAFEAYVQRKWVEPLAGRGEPGDPDNRFAIPEARRPSLEYYKNTGIMPFMPPAFTALAILGLDAFQFASADLLGTYRYLQDILKHEFSFDLERPPEHHVRRSIKAFIDDAVLMPHPTLPDTYNITSAGYRTLGIFAHFCRAYLEAYLVVADYLEGASPESLTAADQLKKMPGHAQRMFKRGDVGLRESASRVTFRNALAYYNGLGAFGREERSLIAPHADRLRRLLAAFH